jgi:hypothetical protein
MFAQGDRVFPLDDLGGGVWSRVGTVVAVHPAALDGRRDSIDDQVRVDTLGGPAGPRPRVPATPARVTVRWDDGIHEVIGEDLLCLVYGDEEPAGIRVVTVAMAAPFDLVQHGGDVILLLRDGLLESSDVALLREKLRRVRARVDETPDTATPAERRLRDLGLLRALISYLTP